jgi:hypothetical protein
MAQLKTPSYCIIYNRAVKLVKTLDGGLAVYVYSPEEDEFKLAIGLLHRFFCGGTETDEVSEEEFNAYVAKQRAEVKRKRGILSLDEVAG